jgi:hypothetical protein
MPSHVYNLHTVDANDGGSKSNLRLALGFVGIAVVFLLLAAAIPAAASPAAQTATPSAERYFDETGHRIIGPFLTFYNSFRNPEIIFGLPITDQFNDPRTGRIVQYFQKARFEWYPDNPEGAKVQLALLGDELGYNEPAPAQIPSANDPYCRYFPETGHSVCNAFLAYFDDNGGVAVFGYPISEAVVVSGNRRIYQAFQRARMEWHPDKPASRRVQLTNVGLLAFNQSGLSQALTAPQPPANAPVIVTKLVARASVDTPVTPRSGSQTVHVVVTNQYGKPVVSASARIVIHLPSGDKPFSDLTTDSRGVIKLKFPFGETRPGAKIPIDVVVTFNNLTTTTSTSFLPWW